MEICHKKLSEQDGIREQGGIFSEKVKQAGWIKRAGWHFTIENSAKCNDIF